MSNKTVAELLESFRVDSDIVDYTKGIEEVIQARVDALAEATREGAFSDLGFIKEAKDTDEDEDKNEDEQDAGDDEDASTEDDDTSDDSEDKEKKKVEESFKETMKNQK